jgi:hypothetical protein
MREVFSTAWRRTRRGPILWWLSFGLAASSSACEVTPGSVSPERQPVAFGLDASAPDAAGAPGQIAAPDARAPAGGSTAPDAAAHPSGSSPLFLRFPDPLDELPRGEEQRARLCARALDDAIADLICAADAARFGSLAQLLGALAFDPARMPGTRGFAIAGHSTALSKRSVSAINPRVIFVQLELTEQPLLALAFTRGETFVELVARSRSSKELEFYALAFELDCARAPAGCAPGDLLTAAVERDWRNVRTYHEEDLANTALDCRACHQPDGPGTRKLLRMHEIAVPWTHWLHDQTRGGRALLEDYFAAHGDEVFAGIPGPAMSWAHPGLLSAFVRTSGFEMQPNEFPGSPVETEVEHSAPGQPADNRTAGQSETWQAVYRAALRGEAIPVPYHDVKITAPEKLARMSRAYADYLAGELPQAALPDIRDVLPDDATLLAEMGVLVDERLDDRALLTAACGLCHNQRLDQRLSRARFHTDLDRLSREAREAAVRRLDLPPEDLAAMPPRRVFALSDAARMRLITLLRP